MIVENRGVISGIGGAGGKGANDGGDAGSGGKNGADGGVGLYSRYPFTYKDAGALTQGGGGGGAGGSCAAFDDHRGGGGGGGAGWPPGAGGVGPQSGEDGMTATLTAKGIRASTGYSGGRSYTSNTFWSSPELKTSPRGGDGGDPGEDGDNDIGSHDVSGGSPGDAGPAIDGLSYLIQDGATGTRTGAQIN